MVARSVLAASLLLGGALPVAGQIAPARADVVADIHADQTGPTISPDIFGQFAEMLGEGVNGGVWVGENSKIPNVRGIRSDVVQALRALKVPSVRWPGGCFADQYDWRDGIDPASRRASHINAAALNLNIFARHADRVRMANIAQMVNVIQSMILTDGGNMLLTPTYHVFRMYVPFQGAKVIPVNPCGTPIWLRSRHPIFVRPRPQSAKEWACRCQSAFEANGP